MSVSDKVKILLKRDNLTAKALTQELGLSATAISDWQRGKSSPSPDVLIAIAKKFNVSADWLLGLTDDPKPIVPSKEAIEALEEYTKTAPKFNVTDEQLAAALPPDIRDSMMALIRIELEKQKDKKTE